MQPSSCASAYSPNSSSSAGVSVAAPQYFANECNVVRYSPFYSSILFPKSKAELREISFGKRLVMEDALRVREDARETLFYRDREFFEDVSSDDSYGEALQYEAHHIVDSFADTEEFQSEGDKLDKEMRTNAVNVAFLKRAVEVVNEYIADNTKSPKRYSVASEMLAKEILTFHNTADKDAQDIVDNKGDYAESLASLNAAKRDLLAQVHDDLEVVTHLREVKKMQMTVAAAEAAADIASDAYYKATCTWKIAEAFSKVFGKDFEIHTYTKVYTYANASMEASLAKRQRMM